MAIASQFYPAGLKQRAADILQPPNFLKNRFHGARHARRFFVRAVFCARGPRKEKGRDRQSDRAPLSPSNPNGFDYILAASLEASAAGAEASSEAGAEASIAASVDSIAASVAGASGAFSEQPARAKAVPATAARRSLRMRYNPWIEVDRAGPAARRKAYSGGRLLAPINRQFTCLQVLGAAKPSYSGYITEYKQVLQNFHVLRVPLRQA